MASTYSDLLKIELIGSGEQSGSWGTTTNNNFSQSIEHSIAGVLSVNTGSSTAVTLTTGDGPQAQADNQARQASLVFTGASANCVVTVPATQKIYFVHNTNASNTITLRLSGTTTDLVLQANTAYLAATTGSAWHIFNDDLTVTGQLFLPEDADADDLSGDSATGRISLGAGQDLNLYHGGTNSYIVNDTGDLIIDTEGDIVLDANGANITFKDNGTAIGDFSNSSSDFVITSSVQDKDIIFKGDDGGSAITALTLDMSAAGAATFNSSVSAPGGITVDNLQLKDGGNEIETTGILLLESNNSDIQMNAVGGDIAFYANATLVGAFNMGTTDFILTSFVSDKDIIFKGNDGGSTVTALTLDMSAAGNATFNGTVTESSDERLKTDIRTIDNALNLVDDMRGVYFTKDNAAGTGVIAQEIEKVLPEVVMDNEEYKSVAYGKIVGVLIEAIKELKKEVETLKEAK
tara:strand:+ start:351 stop:1739 length:1389 start_codon:yes stop_codon:yes gene_type:complete